MNTKKPYEADNVHHRHLKIFIGPACMPQMVAVVLIIVISSMMTTPH